MDPLSIIAGSIAVMGALSATLSFINTLCHSDSEFQELVNEIQNTSAMMFDLEKAIGDGHQSLMLEPYSQASLVTLLTRIKDQLDILYLNVQNKLMRNKPATSDGKVIRAAWLVHKRSIKRLQVGLQESREQLILLLGIANLSNISLIHHRLDDMTNLGERHLIELNNQSKNLEFISRHFLKFQHLNGPEFSTFNAIDTQLCESRYAPDEKQLLRRYADDGDFRGSSPKYAAARSRAAHYRVQSCEGWCSCACHTQTYLHTPTWLRIALGSLMVCCSGFPALQQPCSERNCRRQSVRTVQLNYFFPQWLLSRVMQFAFSVSSATGPEMLLRVPRVVPDNAPLLFFAVQGNMEGIKDLFQKGMASPYDVALSNGRTALHYSVNYAHQELSQFLMDAGASPNVADTNQATSVTLAWERIFSRSCDSSSSIQSWRCMFDDEDYLESRCFPVLHKIVLGLSRGSLRESLSLSTATIDTKDADGRTALSWAAARGDHEAVNTLLEFGANQSLASKRGHTALSWACQSSSVSRNAVIQALIKFHANVNHVDVYRRVPLINATADVDDPQCLKMLLDAGAHIDWRDCHQRTALVYAAKMGHVKNLELLLERGANGQLTDHWGHNALSEAVHQNHHPCLKVLLEQGYSKLGHATKTSGGMNLMHLVAAFADARTMELLRSYRSMMTLKQLSGALNDEGITPVELFMQRKLLDAEMIDGFQQLVPEMLLDFVGISIPTEVGDDIENSEESWEFADALEHQSSPMIPV